MQLEIMDLGDLVTEVSAEELKDFFAALAVVVGEYQQAMEQAYGEDVDDWTLPDTIVWDAREGSVKLERHGKPIQ